MIGSDRNLGKLVALHGIVPAYLQRAVFIVILSFIFFMAMMFVYYIRPSIGYFLLASAFLVVYLVMMLSWATQRRSVVEIYECGLKYRKFAVSWDQIEEVSDDGVIKVRNGKPITLPKTVVNYRELLRNIRSRANVS